jgi:hypothetical protein
MHTLYPYYCSYLFLLYRVPYWYKLTEGILQKLHLILNKALGSLNVKYNPPIFSFSE